MANNEFAVFDNELSCPSYKLRRYLRLIDAHSCQSVDSRVPILCNMCDRTLSYTDQLLCTRRRWGFGA